LVYIQELYSPPIDLNGLRSHTHMIPIDDWLKSHDYIPTFTYTRSQLNYDTCLVLQTLKGIDPKFEANIKEGYMTTVTATIPKDPRHSFWRPLETEGNSSQDRLSFNVQRWGQTEEASYDHAIQRAIDIIRYIYTALSGSSRIPAAKYSMTLTPFSCGIFRLGVELCTVWKKARQQFSKDSAKGERAAHLLGIIQEKYDSDEYIYARPVLRYYKVYP
jgi:hypothetical protein